MKQLKINLSELVATIIGITLLALLVLGLCSCSSLHKTKSLEKLKEDSTHVVKSDSNKVVKSDSSVETSTAISSDKTTIEDGESSINVTFDSGYIPGPTKLFLKDTAGGKLITSNKPLKFVTETTKTSSTKKDIQNSIVDSKTQLSRVDSGSKTTFDSASLKKELKIVNTTKDKHKVGLWWLWLLLIPIAYFALKYLYKSKKLPLAEWVAKALFFV